MSEDNQKLKKEVSLYMTKKIKDVKSVDHIEITDSFHASIYKDITDVEGCYQHVRKCKMTLQILLNLYNNYELFRSFQIKLPPGDMETFRSWYRFDQNNNRWNCFKCPNKSDLEDVFYEYVISILSIQKNENAPYTRNSFDKEKILKCPYCDESIDSDQNQCTVCNATICEMNSIKNTNKERKLNERDKNVSKNEKNYQEVLGQYISKTYQNVVNRSNNLPKNVENFQEISEYINSIPNNDVKSERRSKKCERIITKERSFSNTWKCEKCECLNENTFINCKTCEEIKGKNKDEKKEKIEILDKDTKKNDVSKSCGISKIDESKEVRIGKDEWKCRGCELLQSFEFINCDGCGGSRAENGLWKCEQCTLVNKCKNIKCEACLRENEGLGLHLCTFCRRNKVTLNQTKCDECKRLKSDGVLKKILICEKCTLENNMLGYSCKVCETLNEDDEVKIGEAQWKCCKCGLLQDFSFTNCDVCGGCRQDLGLYKCGKCTVINECKSKICKVCEQQNEHFICNETKRGKVNNATQKMKGNKNKIKEDKVKTIKVYKEEHPGQWECKYINCRNWTGNDLPYCKGCHLYRDHSTNLGDEVKQFRKGTVRAIWICYFCKKYNELNNDKCVQKNCNKPRYVGK